MKQLLVAGFMSLAAPSLACTPLPGQKYDTFEALGQDAIRIGIADVQRVDLFNDVDSNKGCYRVSYTAVENLFGQLPGAFDVQTCLEGVALAELEDDLAFEDNINGFGDVAGAQALIGLVVQSETRP